MKLPIESKVQVSANAIALINTEKSKKALVDYLQVFNNNG